MAKERSEKREKHDKKEKKEKRSETDGVKKSKKEKKDKTEKKEKDKKSKKETKAAASGSESGLDDEGAADASALVDVSMADVEGANGEAALTTVPVGLIVPFANPLADDADSKAVLKAVRHAAKHSHLKRGTKEVVKSLRKSAKDASSLPVGVVILAADISPMDFISHLPVLCEDHDVPYIYVRSRVALGEAGATKRPTSVVMVSAKEKKEKMDAKELAKWEESYKELVRMVRKAQQSVRV
ncbi:H/ACA ribonucleoprotein complex subunit 2 [Cryomyces antarcticus]